MIRKINRTSDLINLSYHTLMNKFAISLYKNFGIDLTYPTIVYAQLTNACDSKCIMCDLWREKNSEVPASVWINAFEQLKTINRKYKIGFAGGEVLLKEDVFELFEYCNMANLPFGITTNGYLLNPNNINRLLRYRPMNINISLDSLDDETYIKIRGVSFLSTVKTNIDYLKDYIEEFGLNTKIFLKTVVNAFNLSELHILAKYAMGKKVAGITFDPVRRRRQIFLKEKIDEFEKMSTIDKKALHEAKNRIFELKKQGFNILNSDRNINDWFSKEIPLNKTFCESPLCSVYIFSDGQIKLCDYAESSIGNILTDDIQTIIKSDKVKIEKRSLSQCENPCVYCIHRNFHDNVKLFFSYLKN